MVLNPGKGWSGSSLTGPPGPHSRPREHSHLKTPRHRVFQELHWTAGETEAQESPELPLLSCWLILPSVFHAFALGHGPVAPSQPRMDQLSDLGAIFAFSGPLSPLPTEWQGKPSGPMQRKWAGFSRLRLPLPSHLQDSLTYKLLDPPEPHTEARLDARLPFLSSSRDLLNNLAQ